MFTCSFPLPTYPANGSSYPTQAQDCHGVSDPLTACSWVPWCIFPALFPSTLCGNFNHLLQQLCQSPNPSCPAPSQMKCKHVPGQWCGDLRFPLIQSSSPPQGLPRFLCKSQNCFFVYSEHVDGRRSSAGLTTVSCSQHGEFTCILKTLSAIWSSALRSMPKENFKALHQYFPFGSRNCVIKRHFFFFFYLQWWLCNFWQSSGVLCCKFFWNQWQMLSNIESSDQKLVWKFNKRKTWIS